MNVDSEFSNIVERLGLIGDIDLRSYASHPATGVSSAGGCTCGPAAPATDRSPKWDPVTRAWWTWEVSKGGWERPI